MPCTHDLIIVGGGLVGSTLACALAKQTNLQIAILESQPSPPSFISSAYHHRVSAISLASQRFFESLGVWNTILNHRVSPFSAISVWDADGAAIHFDGADIAEKQLGFIIENNLIQHTLFEKIKTYSTITWMPSTSVMDCYEKDDGIELITNDEKKWSAKLIIAADGAQSRLREKAGIEVDQHDYQATAIVANLETACPHQSIARQVFLETGPLAFLPLEDPAWSSMVWSLPKEQAQRLMASHSDDFTKALTKAFTYLGEIKHCSERHAFPLVRQQAKNYVKPRIALAGDAAHSIHPLAGQGVNMGLMDAAALTEIIVDEIKKGKDFSRFSALRRYERSRKAENFPMMAAIDLIKEGFGNSKKPVPFFRKCGLKTINHFSWSKKLIVRYASAHSLMKF